MNKNTNKYFLSAFFYQMGTRDYVDNNCKKKFISKAFYQHKICEIAELLKLLKFGLFRLYTIFAFQTHILVFARYLSCELIIQLLYFFIMQKAKKCTKVRWNILESAGFSKKIKLCHFFSINKRRLNFKRKKLDDKKKIVFISSKFLFGSFSIFIKKLVMIIFYDNNLRYEYRFLIRFQKKKKKDVALKTMYLYDPSQKRTKIKFFANLRKYMENPHIHFNLTVTQKNRRAEKINWFIKYTKITIKNYEQNIFAFHALINDNFFLWESYFNYLCFNDMFNKKKINSSEIVFSNLKIKKNKKEKFIKINNKKYKMLELIGKGGSGKVYKILDENNQILALKKTRTFKQDFEILHNCINEISILKTLFYQPRVIKIKNADICMENGNVFIVLEYGESDLENLIKKQKKGMSNSTLIKFFWKQTLEAVQAIHEERIVHGDLKPSNFLLVENSLKIIDFGTAKQIQKDTTNITRTIRVGTLNYMSPEAMVDISNTKEVKKCFKLGRSADIWSLGCILFQMIYGSPPFYHMDFVKKIQAIIDKSYEIMCLPVNIKYAVDVMKGCLQKNPDARPSIPELLLHPFLISRNIMNFKKILV